MALERTRPTTLFQRIRRIIMGKDKPNLITRVSVTGGFILWIYLFSWQLLSLLAVGLMKNLDQYGSDISPAYFRIGRELYGYPDPTTRLFIHSSVQILVYLVILFSLILIWRKRKMGLLVYVIASLTTLFVTITLMGWKYLINETPILDFILLFSAIVYFSIGIIIFHRKEQKKAVLDASDH